MPSSITHAYFAQDVLNKVSDLSKRKICNNDYLRVFAQGPDLFYFYNNLSSNNMKIRSFGGYCHKHKTQEFFVNLVSYIKDNNLSGNGDVMSFLYGYITHMILDSVMHPFIYYKTGVFDRSNFNTYKYNGLHGEMEYYLDIYMIYQKEKKEAIKFKCYKYFSNISKFDDELNKLIDYVFKKTYDKDNMSNYVLKGTKGLRIVFKYIRYDRFGLKKYFYKLVDFFSSKDSSRKEIMSYHVLHNKKLHYLNLDKKTWNHPCDINRVYDLSFVELYIIAIDKASNLINKVNLYLNDDNANKRELYYLFKDTSYITGMDCENGLSMQYFEF